LPLDLARLSMRGKRSLADELETAQDPSASRSFGIGCLAASPGELTESRLLIGRVRHHAFSHDDFLGENAPNGCAAAHHEHGTRGWRRPGRSCSHEFAMAFELPVPCTETPLIPRKIAVHGDLGRCAFPRASWSPRGIELFRPTLRRGPSIRLGRILSVYR